MRHNGYLVGCCSWSNVVKTIEFKQHIIIGNHFVIKTKNAALTLRNIEHEKFKIVFTPTIEEKKNKVELSNGTNNSRK